MQKGILYVVSTPIGNLGDITFRAIDVLKSSDLILCEDTRVTQKLLDHYDIKVPTMSYHANSKLSKHEKILSLLEEGKVLSLVSDAGTPTISDPGVMLISLIKEKFGKDVRILTIPGASALTAALSVSGISSAKFVFYGFLPHKKGRETIFKEIAESDKTCVFFESTHRIEKTLESLKQVLGDDKRVVVTKELTKVFEEVIEGSASEVLEYLKENEDKKKGEFVVIVG